MSGAVLVNHGDSAIGLTAAVNRTSLYGFGYAPGSAQTSESVTCTPVGGTPPYTYAWTKVGVSDIFATAPFNKTTHFTAYENSSTILSEDFICTVTDAAAVVAVTDPVSVTLRFSTGGEDMEILL